MYSELGRDISTLASTLTQNRRGDQKITTLSEFCSCLTYLKKIIPFGSPRFKYFILWRRERGIHSHNKGKGNNGGKGKPIAKPELHAHLNGSLSASTLLQLGCLKENVSEYQKLTQLLHTTDKTLDECFELFRVAHNATTNKESVYLATQSVIKDFYDDNVIYLELRSTPRQEENMSKTDYIESIVNAIQDFKESIIVKLILSVDRRHDLKTSQESIELFIEMKNKYPDIIKGVDFSGNPTSGNFNKNLFMHASDNGLFTTLHCAEVKNDKEVLEILDFKPNRIGHATFLHPKFGGSERLWELYCKHKIPLECCLTSNVICGTATSYKNHHVQEWIKNSLPFSFNTDDKGVFCTTLSRELLLASIHLSLTPRDLWQITYNSIDFSFASNEEKTLLKKILKEWELKHQF